jgi:hypothetical protein
MIWKWENWSISAPLRTSFEVGKQQLRLASYTHAFPKRSARYLMLDCEKPVKTAADLVPGLKFVFDNVPEATVTPLPVTPPPLPTVARQPG